jgi:protein-disulfide isomerase
MATKKTKAAERAERAAALLREQRARERRRNLITGGVVVAVLAALVVVGILISRANEVDAPTASDYGVAIGDPDAPHTLVIYEDFLCPGCGQLEEQSNEELQQLADDGDVYVEYRPFELLGRLGDYSARAASAFGVVLEESGPEVAKEFHDLLFEDQPEEGDEPYPDADWLVEKAVEAGAAESDVRPGIEEGVTSWAEEATAEAQEAGVTGTPTVILDGEVFNGTVPELLEELQ